MKGQGEGQLLAPSQCLQQQNVIHRIAVKDRSLMLYIERVEKGGS